jgi:peptidoglycan/xylan/chitin deacetylase (PgdA/CDA1 family)
VSVHPRLVLVAVDEQVPGMSRLADRVEGEPILPARIALTQRVELERAYGRDEIGVVIPMTHPGTVIEAARLGVERIAAVHPPELTLSRLGAVKTRAAYAMADLTLVPSADQIQPAVAAGADPERLMVLDDTAMDRLFAEPPRRGSRGKLLEGAVSAGLDALELAGVVRALELLSPDRGVNVVNYHRVLPLEELTAYCRPQMAIAEPVFAAQLDQMGRQRGFAPVDRLRHASAKDKVAITFDDGYEDNFRVAFPILARFSTPACIFVVTGLVGRPDALWWDRVGLALFAWWRAGCPGALPELLPERTAELRDVTATKDARELISAVLSDLNLVSDERRRKAVAAAVALVPEIDPQRTMLSWDEVKALADGGVMFGSHTRSHVPLDELDRPEAKAELFGSHADLDETIGAKRYRVTALPRGRLGALTEDELADGFDAVMTTQPGVNRVTDDGLFVKRRDGRMLTLAGRHHEAKLRLELTGVVDRLRGAYYRLRPAARGE